MPDFRKGTAALQEAQKAAKGGGNFQRFAPFISWADNEDEHYLLFLNQWEDMPQVDYIGFIPQKGKKADGSEYTYQEAVIARTDSALGEASDPLTDQWEAKPRASHIAVAVELEPTFTTVKGRKRPSGFEVKTETFSRRVRDADNNLTDETEEVTAPRVGFVVQSPHNFFNVVQSYDAGELPIHETPVKITRVGAKGSNSTAYRLDGYEHPIDLTNLFDNVEFIGYLGEDAGDLLTALDEIDVTDEDQRFEATQLIGNFMLDKRLEELCDKDRYDKIAAQVDSSLDRWGGSKSGKKTDAKPAPARKSQRKAKEEPEAEVEAEAPAEVTEKVSVEENDAKAKIAKLRDQARKRRSGAKATA